MSTRLSLCLLLALFLLPLEAQGNPQQRYAQMLAASPELREADQAIRDTLEEAKKLLQPSDYVEIEKIQAYWERNEFDGNVKAYRDSGLSEAEAWAQEIGSHADVLGRAIDVLNLRRKGKGVEGVYEFHREGNNPRLGIMLVRRVDSSYTVEILVSTGNPAATSSCAFSGEGALRKNRLVAESEESESKVTVTFKGTKATVTSTPTADAQCERGFGLGGEYKK